MRVLGLGLLGVVNGMNDYECVAMMMMMMMNKTTITSIPHYTFLPFECVMGPHFISTILSSIHQRDTSPLCIIGHHLVAGEAVATGDTQGRRSKDTAACVSKGVNKQSITA